MSNVTPKVPQGAKPIDNPVETSFPDEIYDDGALDIDMGGMDQAAETGSDWPKMPTDKNLPPKAREQQGTKSDFQQRQVPQRPQPDNFGKKFSGGFEARSDARPADSTNSLQRPESQTTQNSEALRPDFARPQPRLEKEIQSLLKDRLFQQAPLKDSPLQGKLQTRLQDTQTREQIRQTQNARDNEPLTRRELAQLFRLRNKFEQRDEARRFIRYEAAKAREAAREKVQGLKSRSESKQDGEAGALKKMGILRGEKDSLTERLRNKMLSSGGESVFEEILKKAMGGEDSVPQLASNQRAKFLAKSESEWKAFFKNLFAMNSQSVETAGELNKLIEALFRGIYTEESGGKVLVSDLAFNQSGEVVENKFSQILLKDKDLATLFEKLNPGDVISKDLIKQLGEEFLFLKVIHVVGDLSLSQEQKSAILKEFRNQVSPQTRRHMEDALMNHRQNSAPVPNPLAALQDPALRSKLEDKGRPKLLMAVIYALVATAVMLFGYIVFN